MVSKIKISAKIDVRHEKLFLGRLKCEIFFLKEIARPLNDEPIDYCAEFLIAMQFCLLFSHSNVFKSFHGIVRIAAKNFPVHFSVLFRFLPDQFPSFLIQEILSLFIGDFKVFLKKIAS